MLVRRTNKVQKNLSKRLETVVNEAGRAMEKL